MILSEILSLFGRITPKQAMAIMIRFGEQSHFEHRQFEANFFGMKYQGHTENLIDQQIYFLGTYEAGILAIIKEILSQKPGSVFVDIGANVGVHSLYASLFASKVYAFEPYEVVRSMLDEKVSVNNIKNIEIIPWALGDKNEIKEFHLPPQSNLGMGSFINQMHPENRSENKMLEIFQATEAFAKKGINSASIIKIDTEGFEYQILYGLLEFLKVHRPVIIFEYSSQSLEMFKTVNAVTEFLKVNYDLSALKAVNSLAAIKEPWTPDSFGNVLCMPK